MATIVQLPLFSWESVDNSPEILRLKRVLDVLPDADLIEILLQERKGKRNDYPLEAVWNSLIAGIVFGHGSIESLRRELLRNGELRDICGFDPIRADEAVPTKHVYSRFLGKLYVHEEIINTMFHNLVDALSGLLEDFGVDLAIDGKAIPTHGSKDEDASWGAKTYHHTGKDGELEKKTKWWFGYKLHLMVDANYELPVAFDLTDASASETIRLMPMVEEIEKKHPVLYERVETMAGDRGYDDGDDKAALYDAHDITPLIDTRNMNKKEEGYEALDPDHHDTIYFDGTGRVVCRIDPFEPDSEKAFADMQFQGFEKDRQTLKFRCPATAFGLECHNREACHCRPTVRDGEYGRVVRVPLERNRRIFLPTHRHSRGFREAYKKRSSVERVNSRIDQVYGFEHHFIRGLKKMRLRVGLALIVMLATAQAWVLADRKEKIRSLVQAA